MIYPKFYYFKIIIFFFCGVLTKFSFFRGILTKFASYPWPFGEIHDFLTELSFFFSLKIKEIHVSSATIRVFPAALSRYSQFLRTFHKLRIFLCGALTKFACFQWFFKLFYTFSPPIFEEIRVFSQPLDKICVFPGVTWRNQLFYRGFLTKYWLPFLWPFDEIRFFRNSLTEFLFFFRDRLINSPFLYKPFTKFAFLQTFQKFSIFFYANLSEICVFSEAFWRK